MKLGIKQLYIGEDITMELQYELNNKSLDNRVDKLKHFNKMDSTDGTIYGSHNTLKMINPFKSRLIVSYPDGTKMIGKNLFDTGWDSVHDGIESLMYELSTGHMIIIPKFRAFLPLVEVSDSIQGNRIFHNINVKCMGDYIFNYRIVLKQDKFTKYKIGDIIITKELKAVESPKWKFSA